MSTKNDKIALPLLTCLFFIWGFITCLNDILIPHLKSIFTLNYAQAMLVQFCFFAAYFIVSVPSGYLIEKLGYKGGIVLGLSIAGLGCLLFYPAATIKSYPFFLIAFFILACGITLLQVSANPYVTILGDNQTASSRLTLTQAFNSLGTTIAPYIGALLILDVALKTPHELNTLSADALLAYQLSQVSSVQLPYLGLAALLFLLALLFWFIRLPDIKPTILQHDTVTAITVWRYRHLLLGAIAIFVYVGAEVSIGSFLVSFLSEPSIGNLSEKDAGRYLSFYWGGAMLGRFIGAVVMQKIMANKVLLFNAMIAICLLLLTIFTQGNLAMWTILSIGLCNSIMFPTIFSLSIQGLGDKTSEGSGVLCAAIVGGAILPFIQGSVADYVGIQTAFILPVFCYTYIAYFAWRGHQFIV